MVSVVEAVEVVGVAGVVGVVQVVEVGRLGVLAAVEVKVERGEVRGEEAEGGRTTVGGAARGEGVRTEERVFVVDGPVVVSGTLEPAGREVRR